MAWRLWFLCNRSRRVRWIANTAIVIALLAGGSARGQVGRTASDLLEEQTDRLVAKQDRSADAEDRILAEGLFAHGRMLLQSDQPAAALARYERAFRYDPAPVIAREIMGIATDLNRHAEAIRYAILSARLVRPAPELAVRLAAISAGQGDFADAIALLNGALHPGPSALDGVDAVLARAELMRLCLLADQVDQAATAATAVWEVLAQPEGGNIPAAARARLTAQQERMKPLVAESFLRAHRPVEAETVFRSIASDRPNAATLAWNLARVAAEKKEWRQAREQLDRYFEARVTTAGLEPFSLLSQIHSAEHADPVQARQATLSALKQLSERDPENSAIGYALAARLMAAEDWGAAAKVYERLLPDHPTTTAYRDLVQIYRRLRDIPALLAVIARAAEQPGNRELLGVEGSLIAKDADLLGGLVRRVKQPESGATPQALPGLLGVCLLAIEARQTAVARDLYRRAVTIPDVDGKTVREPVAMAALVADQFAFAAEVFEQAIVATSPRDKLPEGKMAAYYYYLAGAKELAGDTAGGLAAAEKCAELNRDSVAFQLRPAWVLFHARRLDQAKSRYVAVVEKFQPQFDSQEIRDQLRQARLVLSNICVLQGQLPEAEEWLEQVLDEFPQDIGAMNDLGYLWADQGKRLPRAARMIEQAIAADPDNAAYRDSLGWVYYRLGRYQDAVRELERAVATQSDGVIYDHLGDAFWKLQQREQAVRAWRQSVELLTDSEESRQRDEVARKIKQHSVP